MIDMQHIINLAKRINIAKKNVSDLWMKIASLESMTTLYILRVYIKLMTFMNEHEQAFGLEKNFRSMHSTIVLSKTFKYIVGEDFRYKEEGVAVVSVTKMSLGTIDYCNNYLASMFGYTTKELNRNRINVLMPEAINRVHDSFLKEFIEDPLKDEESCAGWEMMGRHKNGYLFPIAM